MTVPILVAGCALTLVACGSTPETAHRGVASSSTRPNVLLVTIDTLRADHVSSYGYYRRTTPFLDELSSQGVRFERAYSTSSWTVPAVASLLTSLPPSSHGLLYGYITTDGNITDQQVLADEHLTLPEVFRDAGYRTYAVTANGHLAARFGFAQGFDRYVNIGFLNAPDVESSLRPIRQDLVDSSPWFLWVHYFDPHTPYRAYPLALADFLDGEDPESPEILDLSRIPNRAGLVGLELQWGDRNHGLITALYDSEIRYVDEFVRRLVASVGLTDNDVIVVTSDHGEELVDHGDVGHGHSLYEEAIRVPMIIRLPGLEHAGRTVTHPVSLVDLYPTLAARLGLENPREATGRDLGPLIEGHEADPVPVRVSVSKIENLEALILGSLKIISKRDEDALELYDLSSDPQERRNLARLRPALTASLDGRLLSIMAREAAGAFEAETARLDDERLEALRHLGYID